MYISMMRTQKENRKKKSQILSERLFHRMCAWNKTQNDFFQTKLNIEYCHVFQHSTLDSQLLYSRYACLLLLFDVLLVFFPVPFTFSIQKSNGEIVVISQQSSSSSMRGYWMNKTQRTELILLYYKLWLFAYNAIQPMYGGQCLFKIKQTISAVVIAIQIQISVGSRFIRQPVLAYCIYWQWQSIGHCKKKFNLFFVITLHIHNIRLKLLFTTIGYDMTKDNYERGFIFAFNFILQMLVAAVVMTHNSYLQITWTKSKTEKKNTQPNCTSYKTVVGNLLTKWTNVRTNDQPGEPTKQRIKNGNLCWF